MLKISLFAFLLAIPLQAIAEENAVVIGQGSKTLSSANMLQSMFALLLVLAMIMAFVWLLRKSGSLNLIQKSDLSIIAGLSLGMREKLVLVKVGEKQLLLGVTAGRIDKLLELEGEQRLFQQQYELQNTSQFAEKLRQFMNGKNNA